MDRWLRSVSDDGLDPPDGGTAEVLDRAWSPAPGLVGLAWAGAAAAVTWCVLVATTGDRAGLLFAAVAALGLGVAALYGTRARPRLRVDASGVTVGGLSAPRHHTWAEVGEVRVLTVRRLGRTSTLLEIDVVDRDGEERLLVFGRLDLDDDPTDVAAVVRAARAQTS